MQIVTWNDWGEGTQIEPSVQVGYRDLETTQRLRRKFLDPAFTPTAAALRLPVEWLRLRRKYAANPAVEARLDTVFPMVVAGQLVRAQAVLAKYSADAAKVSKTKSPGLKRPG